MYKKYFFLSIITLISISILFSTLSGSYNKFFFPIQTNYILTSSFGYRTFDNSFHNGVDLAAIVGVPVYSINSGTVTYAAFDNSGGYMIIIEHSNGYKSMYCHLDSSLKVKNGDYVKSRQLIGYIGPKYLEDGRLNGYTTGVHLHYGLYLNNKSINPFSVNYSK
ncbi:MAG: M23 family metallopeptidase [Clostridia bacterium]|nr:M23 family metallopeptidase [Clostridia bacterium]